MPAPGAILVDAANDALLRDAEGPHDIDLAARTLADQLGSEHPKRVAVGLGVMKDWLSATEVCPLKKVVSGGPGAHRPRPRRYRPAGYNPIERSRDGHGFCRIGGLNGWVRGAFWEKCRPIASQKRESKPAAMRGQAGD